MRVEFHPKHVCTKRITFEIDNGRIYNVKFSGGCPGNLAAVSKLVDGNDARTVALILRGNKCGSRPTSCADQLAIAIEEAMSEEHYGEHTVQIGEHLGRTA